MPNGDDDCATVKRCENVPSGGRYFAVGSNVGGRLASRDWATRAEPPLREDGHPQRRRRRRRQNPSSVTWGPRSAFVAERCHKTVSCTARSARRREKYIRGNEWRHRRGTLRRCFRCLTSRGRRALVRSRLQCEYGMKAKAVIPAKCGASVTRCDTKTPIDLRTAKDLRTSMPAVRLAPQQAWWPAQCGRNAHHR